MTEDTFDRRPFLERIDAGFAAASIGTVHAAGLPGKRSGFPPEINTTWDDSRNIGTGCKQSVVTATPDVIHPTSLPGHSGVSHR